MAQQIHHQHTKKAERMGVQLSLEPEYNRAVAFWPAHNLRIFGQDPRWALEQMAAAQKVIKENAEHTIKMVNDPASPWNVQIYRNGQLLDGSMPPALWANEELMDHIPFEPGELVISKLTGIEDVVMEEMNEAATEPNGPNSAEFIEDIAPTIDGVPTNGRVAHRKGFMTPDCPFTGKDPEAEEQWLEEWEASAEEAATTQEKAKEAEKIGSVVKSKFRAKYAELGHPTHCGDEMAIKLNNLVANGSRTDIEAFKAILDANGVDMSKYNTTNLGWQGRYRMTGRNKLAKIVHSNGGELKMPSFLHGGESMRMSEDWMKEQRFKK